MNRCTDCRFFTLTYKGPTPYASCSKGRWKDVLANALSTPYREATLTATRCHFFQLGPQFREENPHDR